MSWQLKTVQWEVLAEPLRSISEYTPKIAYNDFSSDLQYLNCKKKVIYKKQKFSILIVKFTKPWAMGHNFLYILSSTFMEISHKPGFCTSLKSCIECFNKLVLWKTVCAVIPLPLIQTYAAALIANTSKNRMKRNVSRLLAVTRFTPNKIVLRSFPC